MCRLRKKLAPIGWSVKGLHGFGYRLVRLPDVATDDEATGQATAESGTAGQQPFRNLS
jgi:hypothetical protein